MAYRSETARDEVFSGQSVTDAFRGIFRIGGGWGNVSGPGLLYVCYCPCLRFSCGLLTVDRMTRIVLSGTMTAVSLGLGSAIVFAIMYGTAALPFLVGSTVGFGLGAYGFYKDAVTKAVLAVERYPLLLRLHMHANFPSQRFDMWDVATMQTAFRREKFPRWQLTSMLLASWMTATPAMDVCQTRP